MESNKSIIGYQLLENVEIAQKQKANLFVYKNPMDVLQNYPPACAAKSQALYAVLYIDREHILEYTADSWIVNYFKIINVHGPLQWIQYCASEALRSNAKVLTQHADRRVAVTPGSKSIATSTKTAGISKSLGIDSISSCVGDRSVAISMNSRSIAACIGPKSFAYQEGRGGLAVSTGYRSESRADCNGIAFAMGRHGVVSGTYGCWIGCAEYGDDGVTIVNIKFAFVDNVKIKEYTRYKLRDGEFVPVDEQ
jgi:hypothetical protein